LLNSDKNAQGLPSLLLHKQLLQSKSATRLRELRTGRRNKRW